MRGSYQRTSQHTQTVENKGFEKYASHKYNENANSKGVNAMKQILLLITAVMMLCGCFTPEPAKPAESTTVVNESVQEIVEEEKVSEVIYVKVYKKVNGDPEDYIRIEQRGAYDENPVIKYGAKYTGPDYSESRDKLMIPTKYNGSSDDYISIDVSGYYLDSETTKTE